MRDVALGHGGGDQVAEAGPQIGNGDIGGVERRRSLDDAAMGEVAALEAAGLLAEALAEELDLGSHLHQRLGIAEAVLIDRLVHHRESLRLGHQHDEGLLPVGHEAGMHVGLQRDRA